MHLQPRPVERFTARSALGLIAVGLGGAAFALLLLTVVVEWEPLRAVDSAVASALNDVVSGHPVLLSVLRVFTHLGGSPINWLIIAVVVGWLLIRRLPWLALYAVVTGAGAAFLSPAVKELVDRARPVVDIAVAAAPGRSFPSGHAFGSMVSYGLLLLVFLPVVPRRARVPVIAAAGALLVGVGFTRVALGVHYVSDVVAGWALGAAWLGVTAAAFRTARREAGLPVASTTEGLEPDAAPYLEPAPDAPPKPLAHPWHTAARLAVAWTLLFGVLVGAGLLITEVLVGTVVDRVDTAIVRWFASLRNAVLSPLMDLASQLGSTAVIVAVLAIAAPLSLATTRRWRPAIFLAVVMVGEVTLFVAVARLIGRPRPPVPHLGPELPPTSSFPSGHVAASIAMYGGIALLALAWSHGRRRWIGWIAVTWGVLAPVLVAAARLYRGVHFATDVLGSMLLTLPWLAVCWRLLDPGPQRALRAPGRTDDTVPVESRGAPAVQRGSKRWG